VLTLARAERAHRQRVEVVPQEAEHPAGSAVKRTAEARRAEARMEPAERTGRAQPPAALALAGDRRVERAAAPAPAGDRRVERVEAGATAADLARLTEA
jgi:hypothetical protein